MNYTHTGWPRCPPFYAWRAPRLGKSGSAPLQRRVVVVIISWETVIMNYTCTDRPRCPPFYAWRARRLGKAGSAPLQRRVVVIIIWKPIGQWNLKRDWPLGWVRGVEGVRVKG